MTLLAGSSLTLASPASATVLQPAVSGGLPAVAAAGAAPHLVHWSPVPYAHAPIVRTPVLAPSGRSDQTLATAAGSYARAHAKIDKVAQGPQLATTTATTTAATTTTSSMSATAAGTTPLAVVAGSGSNNRVLILSSTVTGGVNSTEAAQAVADGFGVDVVDPTAWATMTATNFAAYRAIVLGDPTCSSEPAVSAAEANARVWGPVVNGNIEIFGSDPVDHQTYTNSAITAVTQRAVDFATAKAGTTGAYISLSCYFGGTAANTHVALLDGLDMGGSGFSVQGAGCSDAVHIEATSPAFTGVNDALLSNWSCSVHEFFTSWPARFGVLAVDTNAGSLFTGQDGTVGDPYVLVYPGGSFQGTTETAGGGTATGHNNQCQNGKNPINCATGEFWHTFKDLAVAGRGPGLDLSRTYSSLEAGTDSPFGYGWNTSYGMSVRVDPAGGAVQVTQENGSTTVFSPGTSGYTAPPRVYATLAKNPDGTWTFIRRQRQRFMFDAAGRLSQVSDLNGYTTQVNHNAGGQITTVVDPAGRGLTMTYGTNAKISKVTDPAGRAVSYAYDAAGQLTAVTDVGGGTTTFAYDASGNHLITSMTNPRGGVVSNVYDSTGRVTSQADQAGRTTTYAFSDAGTTITDARGNQSVQSYTQGQLTALTKGSGTPQAATWKYVHDDATLATTSVTDPNGHTGTFAYSGGSFDPTSVTDPLGHTTTVAYNTFGEPTTVNGPALTVTNTYDSAGNLLSTSRPIGATSQQTSYGYGDTADPGDVTASTDPNGKVWLFSYDGAGDITAGSDPIGNKRTYGYDAISRRTSTVSPRGNAPGAVPATFTSTVALNAFGDPTRVTDALGHGTQMGYDASRNQTSVTDPLGHVSMTSFDAVGEPVTVTRADGTTISSAYDANGNRISQVDGKGKTTAYAFDPLNRLSSVTDPLNRVTTYSHDGAGNPTALVDPAGATTSYGYDAGNEPTTVGYSDNKTAPVTLTYTPAGLRASMVDGTGTTSYTYDGLNRLTAQSNGASQGIGYGYDLVGHLTALTYPNGKTVTRGYDAAGRLTALTDWTGHTSTLTPDADGNTATATYGNAVTAATTYDPTGAMSTTTDKSPAGVTLASLAYTRDANSQLTSTTPTGLPGAGESYSYSQLNQLTTVNVGAYSYDAADNLTKLVNGTTLGYDNANQASSYTPTAGPALPLTYDARGDRTTGPVAGGATASYAYDQANRLTAATTTTVGGGSAASLISAGQYHSVAVDTAGAVWAWGYNAYGQLGTGNTTSATKAVKVAGAPAASAITAGLLSSVELTRTGTLSAWGNNSYGQLGTGNTTSSSVPVPVSALSGVTAVGAGNYHALAVRTDGTVTAWGLNNAGQLGDATTTNRAAPVTVKALTGVTAVAAGGLPGYAGHSVALKSDGTVWTWGYGKSGQLGLGAAASTATPTKVLGLPAIAQISANGDDTYALGRDGTLWAWGAGSYGQIGNTAAGNTQATPLKVNLAAVKSVAAGGTHALAVTSDGAIWAWGNNNTGQLGDGGACGKTCTNPVKVAALTGATAVAGGYVHSLVALADGTMRGWGRNAEGELGDGTTTVRATPVTVSALAGIGGASSSSTSTYTYDGDGARATRVTGGATQRFGWDLVASVPLLLTDGSTSYLYDDTGTPVEQVDAAGTALYYQHDQYGSTRLLTSQTGTVAATFTYDAYGNLTGRTGTADTPLRWNGQYQDTDTGLYYLRARYYDPATAQFLTRDPLVALTGSAYGYGGGNPLNAADPSGLMCFSVNCLLTDAAVVAAGVAVVAAVVVLAPEIVVASVVAITVEEVAAVAVTEGGGLLAVSAAAETVGVTAITTTSIAGTVGTGAEIAGYVIGGAKAAYDCSGGLSSECKTSILEIVVSFGAGRVVGAFGNDWLKLANDVREFALAVDSNGGSPGGGTAPEC